MIKIQISWLPNRSVYKLMHKITQIMLRPKLTKACITQFFTVGFFVFLFFFCFFLCVCFEKPIIWGPTKSNFIQFYCKRSWDYKVEGPISANCWTTYGGSWNNLTMIWIFCIQTRNPIHQPEKDEFFPPLKLARENSGSRLQIYWLSCFMILDLLD